MRVLLVLFILGINGIAYSERCPDYEDLEPCSCRPRHDGNIAVTCDEVTSDELKQAMRLLIGKQKVEINFEFMNLGRIPYNFFQGIEVVRLDFYSCEIDSFTDDNKQTAFAGLEDTLRELAIHDSIHKENTKAGLNFGHLLNLRDFSMSLNTVKKLSNDMFQGGPASLRTINFNSNRIEEFGDTIFANLTNLRSITVVHEKITAVRRSMAPTPADNLISINLGYNLLTSIPEDSFNDMPNLNTIHLNDNEISRLDKATWEPVWEQLDKLNLEGNPLECDSNMSWAFEMDGPSDIDGYCDGDYKKPLKDFIENKGQ